MKNIRLHWGISDKNRFAIEVFDMSLIVAPNVYTIVIQLWFKRAVCISYELEPETQDVD